MTEVGQKGRFLLTVPAVTTVPARWVVLLLIHIILRLHINEYFPFRGLRASLRGQIPEASNGGRPTFPVSMGVAALVLFPIVPNQHLQCVAMVGSCEFDGIIHACARPEYHLVHSGFLRLCGEELLEIMSSRRPCTFGEILFTQVSYSNGYQWDAVYKYTRVRSLK